MECSDSSVSDSECDYVQELPTKRRRLTSSKVPIKTYATDISKSGLGASSSQAMVNSKTLKPEMANYTRSLGDYWQYKVGQFKPGGAPYVHIRRLDRKGMADYGVSLPLSSASLLAKALTKTFNGDG